MESRFGAIRKTIGSAFRVETMPILVCYKQEAISRKEIVFRFRKDIQSAKGWGFDILCMRSPGVKGICANALLCAILIRSVART